MPTVQSDQSTDISRVGFGIGMLAVGVLALAYGTSALTVTPLPEWLPWHHAIGYAAGALLIGTGVTLLFERTAAAGLRVLLPFLVLWMLSRVPVPIGDPGRELSWFVVGVVAVPTVAAFLLRLRLLPPTAEGVGAAWRHAVAIRLACWVFGLSVVTFGLSHFFEFAARTVSLVPAWLPFRTGWAYLAGAGQVAAGLGVALGVLPRLAATAEAVMLSAFTVLVWIPAVVTAPGLESNWVEFVLTGMLAASSWVVATSIPKQN